MTASRRAALLLTTALLLLLAASRIPRLNAEPMNPDEIWAVWQTFGSPADIVRWTPYDWPPLYYLTLGAWRSGVGAHPVLVRALSVLVFVVGAACLYRAARRLGGERAAWLACLGYGALGYNILLSTEARGYALLTGLLPLAFWLMQRYFHRPTLRRALPFAGALAALLYTSSTSIGALAMLGLYAVIVYRRGAWRGWLPAVMTMLLALPEVLAKSQIAVQRVSATTQAVLPPLDQALYTLLFRWAGYALPLWLVLTVAAAVLLLRRGRAVRPVPALLLWAAAMPLLLYLTHPVAGFFSARYAWWVMLGIALLAGLGLARLPRLAAAGAGALLAGALFLPLPWGEYNIFENLSPLGENFAWLQDHLQTGDVLLLDPAARCGAAEEWDYYRRLYFPAGFTFVSQPGSHRRVWYITFDGGQTPALQQAVARGRVAGAFIGPAGCLFRLYEGPPDARGVPFANNMRFHGAELLRDGQPWDGPAAYHEGDTLRLRLWWTVDRPVDLDYSVGVYAMRGQTVVAASDTAPQPASGPVETSRWEPGRFYIETRDIPLPFPGARGPYSLVMAVYFWQDNERIDAPGLTPDGLLPLRTIEVMAY